MSFNPSQSPNVSPERRLNRLQKTVGGVLVVAICGLVAILLANAAVKKDTTVSPDLTVAGSRLDSDSRTGKLIWTGQVINHSAAAQAAPWVRVTLYDPEGDSVDSGEATTKTSSIPAGGQLSYITVFDTRGNHIRALTSLERADSRPLGM